MISARIEISRQPQVSLRSASCVCSSLSRREFGFGLSYTTFRFAVDGPPTLHASTDAMAAAHGDYYLQGGGAELLSSPLVYTVNVTNTGSVASDVVVLGTHLSSEDTICI